MNLKPTLILLLTAIAVNSFAFNVGQNTYVKFGKNTTVKLTNMDLQNGGTLFGDTSSLVIMSASKEKKITGKNGVLPSLKIVGNITCEVPELTINGDLILQSGVMNIGANKVIIFGDLLGETDKTYLTATNGTLEKPLQYLPYGRSVELLGLDFTPLHEVYQNKLIRSHNSTFRPTSGGNYRSANRVYTFEKSIDIAGINLQVLPHETDILTAYGGKKIVFVELTNTWQKVVPSSDYYGVSRISIFPPNGLSFPKILSPNGDGTNDHFSIEGLEEYPNAKLLIITKEGKIIHEFSPYKNDFDGTGLASGTYYYVFYSEEGAAPKKSFFELIR